MNAGILHAALTGTLRLELEYHEPSKENSDLQGELSADAVPQSSYRQPQATEEFACLLLLV